MRSGCSVWNLLKTALLTTHAWRSSFKMVAHLWLISSSQENAKPGTRSGCSAWKALASADSMPKPAASSFPAVGASSEMRPMHSRK